MRKAYDALGNLILRMSTRANGQVGWVLFLLFFMWGLYMWAKSGFHASDGKPIQP